MEVKPACVKSGVGPSLNPSQHPPTFQPPSLLSSFLSGGLLQLPAVKFMALQLFTWPDHHTSPQWCGPSVTEAQGTPLGAKGQHPSHGMGFPIGI